MKNGESITVSVKVKNVGKRAGTTVVQMYICDQAASLVRPVKELKGYQKICLQPQEERMVTFTITEKELAFWTAKKLVEAEKGQFTVWVSDVSNKGDGVVFTLV